MATFVLVHGAWHGGWCWAGTEAALRRAGHDVHSPTLTGLGERSHLLTADITADTHVLDIVNVLRWRELRDVILVGHSYGGLVVTGVASHMPERIRALVYLDAFVPEVSQDSVFGKANPERMAAFQKQIDAGAIGLEPDGALESWTSDPNARDWLQRQCTPHPPKTLQAGPILTGQQSRIEHRHYILAAKNDPSAFQAEYRRLQSQQGWTFDSMPTWHDAMVEAPEDLAARLDEYSAHLPDLSKEARI